MILISESRRSWERLSSVVDFGRMFLALSLLCTLSTTAFGDSGRILVDGSFDDWTDENVVARDPEGDAKDAFDLGTVSAHSDGSVLYLLLDIGASLNLQNGDRDDGTLKLQIGLPNGKQFEVDFRKRWACFADNPDETIPWTELQMATLPTYASELTELRIDLSRVGVSTGDIVQIQFDGSDSLDEPVAYKMKESSVGELGEPSFDREESSDLRLVSMNTWNQGLSDRRRAAAVRRLLSVSDGDVFCFQEERDEESFRASVGNALPENDGELRMHWSNGCAIASYLPMEALPLELDRGAAAVIESESGESLVVVSVHFKCCGYSGSPEDAARIDQAKQLADEIKRMRDGDYGDSLRNAAVVVVGDYNLVGSRTPLDRLEEIGLVDELLFAVANDAATTWRGRPQDSFWPGRLDWLTYDSNRLATGNSYLLDTARLSADSLRSLGLEAADSEVSDHLMIVCDFRKKH